MGQAKINLFPCQLVNLSTYKFNRGVNMFGIGMPELIVILIIALIVFGPKKLPEMGKALGRAIKEFRKTSQELKEEIELDDLQEPLNIEKEEKLKKK